MLDMISDMWYKPLPWTKDYHAIATRQALQYHKLQNHINKRFYPYN